MKAKFTLTVLVLAAAGAFAQAPTSNPGSSVTGGMSAPQAQPGTGTRNAESRRDDAVPRSDRKFVQKAAASGMFEVQVAQLAASKATDPQVKSYASMLVDHHTAANNELVKMANARGLELPAAPPHRMLKRVEAIGKRNGTQFDAAFIRQVGIAAHEKDIKLFEGAGKRLKDPELRAFVDKTLPVLRQHLAAAQKLPQASGGRRAALGRGG